MKRSYIKRGKKKLGRSKTPRKKYELYLDDLWRTVIHIRDKGLNQYALIKDGVEKPGKDAHHIFSRRVKNTRWDITNGILVMGAHNFNDPHVHPVRFHEWVRNKWFKSPAEYDMLKIRSELMGVKIDRAGTEILLTQELMKIAKLEFGWYTLSFHKRKQYLLKLRKEV